MIINIIIMRIVVILLIASVFVFPGESGLRAEAFATGGPMRVGVTGATGFVGRAVVAALCRRGDEVTILTRNPATALASSDVRVECFDVNGATPNPQALNGLEAIVHLAGETVDGRWTPAKKRAIFDSRVGGTRNLVASLAACRPTPGVLVAASAIGYYGDRGDEPLDETSEPGKDFMAGLCVGWEREAQAATKLGMRVASVRVSMVVGTGGAVGKLLPIFRAGLGGPLGSGRQWMPWIHIDDIADLFCFILDREEISGPISAVAPDYATNHRFMQAIGHAIGRPALAIAPAFALKLVVGEFAETLLGGQLIVPSKALDAGFVWKHPDLEAAVIETLASESGRTPAVERFNSKQLVRAPLEKVFAFFGDATSLEKIEPQSLRLRTATARPVEMRRGAVVDYSLRVHGVGVRWRALITEWTPRRRFVDLQVRGPFAWWRHTHEFDATDGGVMVRDQIEYTLPFAPLSSIVRPLVRSDLERIFEYRRRAVEGFFAA